MRTRATYRLRKTKRLNTRAHHGISFSDLQSEILHMIYPHCLSGRYNTIKPAGKVLQDTISAIDAANATAEWYKFKLTSCVKGRHKALPRQKIAISLLRVNKQIHHEAATFLYSNNTFHFHLEIRKLRQRAMKVSIPYFHDGFSSALVETLTAITPQFLRLIPNIDIVIRLPYYYPGTKAEESYLSHKARIKSFASCLLGIAIGSRA